MAGMDAAMISDVVELFDTYQRILGPDAGTAAMQAHLLMVQNRHLAELNQRLVEISDNINKQK
jgi:hypothetical protein